MRWVVVLLAAFGLVACGGATTGTSRQTDDASIGSGGTVSSTFGSGAAGSGGAVGSSGGSGGGTGSTGGIRNITHASASGDSSADAASCSSPLVSTVEPSDAGGLPTGSCGCSSVLGGGPPPRVRLSCPTVRGPRDSGTVAPGDLITLTFDLTNEDGLAYPCFGLVGDHGVVGAEPQITIYYLKPTRDFRLEMSARVPASLKPGTVVHFSAYVVASPCPRNLARLDFDVTVG